MIEEIGNLIRYIVIIIFLSALLEMLLPQGVFRRYLRMLVGILLIFTLLTPLQRIMRLAPYWEAPVFSEGISSETELEEILMRGKEMYKDNLNLALEDYRYRIFSLLEGELSRKLGLKLLRLEVSMEENPESKEFGVLKSIYAEVRKIEDFNSINKSEKDLKDRVEDIKIKVEITEHDKEGKEGKGKEDVQANESIDATSNANGEGKYKINDFIATYLQLPSEKVEVKILP